MSFHLDVVRSLRLDQGKNTRPQSEEAKTRPAAKTSEKPRRKSILSPASKPPPTERSIVTSSEQPSLAFVPSSAVRTPTAIIDYLDAHCGVTSVDLSNLKIADEGLEPICEALAQCQSLAVLNLSATGMRIPGAVAVSGILHHPVLQKLTCSSNMLYDPGAAALADSLINSRLTYLALENCGISAVGADRLAQALRAQRCLQTLLLHQNDVGDEGAFAFARLLPPQSALCLLGLNRNGITRIGGTRLCQAWKARKGLAITLAGNRISRKEGEELQQVKAQLVLT